jgi:FlaA1/EpsC-like NDP-sugar epimerase
LRPGEKLYEELLIGDHPMATDHSRIMKARETFVPWAELEPKLEAFQAASARGDAEAVLALLRELVQGYAPAVERNEASIRAASALRS